MPTRRARRTAAVLAAAGATFFAGCGDDDDGPQAPRLERGQVEAKLLALRAYYADPIFRSIADYRPEELYVPLVALPRAVAARAAEAGDEHRAASAPQTFDPTIPQALRGRTYVRDLQQGRWVASARAGGPADGIRFVVPVRAANGAWTAGEAGVVDVRDRGTASEHHLAATVVDAAGVEVALLETRQPRTLPPAVPDSRAVAGRVSRPAGLVDFSSSLATQQGAVPRQSETYRWSMPGASLAGVSAWSASAARQPDDSASAALTLDGLRVRFVRRASPGPDGLQLGDRTLVLLNDRPYAVTRPSTNGATFDFSLPDGSEMPSDPRYALSFVPLLLWGYGEWPLVLRATVAQWVQDVLRAGA